MYNTPEAYYLNDCWHDDDPETGLLVPNGEDDARNLSGDVVCADCYNDNPEWQCPDGNDEPITDTQSTDAPTHCDHCYTLLTVFHPTDEGMTYIHEYVMDAVERAAVYDRWQEQRDQLTLQGMAWSEPPKPRTTVVLQWWDAWSDYDYLDLPRMDEALGLEYPDAPVDVQDWKDDIADAIENLLQKWSDPVR